MKDKIKIGISGLGFVGGAMLESFKKKEYTIGKNLFIYDKFKDGGIGLFELLLKTDIIFLALPTPFSELTKSYDISNIESTLNLLKENNFENLVVIKSTVEPLTTENLSNKYKLNLVHNPEFLTSRSAFEDFHNQKHIVLGKSSVCSDEQFEKLKNFYQTNYENINISVCNSTESETMKLFCNCFYATKIQFFNEMYLLCKNLNLEYNLIKDMMLKNGWINSMHTQVPGPDGHLSFGGACFTKDTNALLHFMKNHKTMHNILEAVMNERNFVRENENMIISNINSNNQILQTPEN